MHQVEENVLIFVKDSNQVRAHASQPTFGDTESELHIVRRLAFRIPGAPAVHVGGLRSWMDETCPFDWSGWGGTVRPRQPVLRDDDAEEKLVVSPAGRSYLPPDIEGFVRFQEQFFRSRVVT